MAAQLHDPFAAGITHRTASLRIDRMLAERLAAGRHRTLAGHGEARSLVLLHALAGEVLVEGDRPIRIAEGDLLALDEATARAAAVVVRGSALAILIPLECLGRHGAGLARATGRAVSTTSDATPSLVAQMLKAVDREIDAARQGGLVEAADHLIGLLALALATPDAGRAPSSADHLDRAKAFIDDNLGDVALSPDRIARHANVSTRTLHRSFEADGTTIGGWIRLRRLERCRRDLIDPALASLPVSAVGTRWGLWDAAHFSRVFKQWTGSSPSAYRSAHARGETLAGLRSA